MSTLFNSVTHFLFDSPLAFPSHSKLIQISYKWPWRCSWSSLFYGASHWHPPTLPFPLPTPPACWLLLEHIKQGVCACFPCARKVSISPWFSTTLLSGLCWTPASSARGFSITFHEVPVTFTSIPWPLHPRFYFLLTFRTVVTLYIYFSDIATCT